MVRGLGVVIALCILVTPLPLMADELRVIDSRGLTRAATEVQAKGSVVVQLDPSEAKAELQHRLGVMPTQHGERRNGHMHFADVPAGVWELITVPEATVIRSVEVRREAGGQVGR